MKSQDIENKKNGKPVKEEITPLQFVLILVSIACCGVSAYLTHQSIQEMDKLQQANQSAKELMEGTVKEDVYYEPVLPKTIVYQEPEEEPATTAINVTDGKFLLVQDQILAPIVSAKNRNKNLNSFRKMSDADWEKLEHIIGSITTPDMNRVEKIKAVHDWMVLHICYDLSYTQHNASNVLNTGIAVCSGYSALFANSMDVLGIPNKEIYGMAYNSMGGGGHAWNLVQLEDGLYYLVDVTWDDPLMDGLSSDYQDGFNLRYDYFLVAPGNVSGSHVPEIKQPKPLATENCNWMSYINQHSYEDSNPTPDPAPSTDNTPEPDSEPKPSSDITPTPEPPSDITPKPSTDTTPTPEPTPKKDPSKGIDVEPNDNPGAGEFTGGVVGEDGIMRSEKDESIKNTPENEAGRKVESYRDGEYVGYYYIMPDESIVNGPFKLPDDL